VVNLPKVNEWQLRKIIHKEENPSERDIIVIILDQDGNQDIGLVELGNTKIDQVFQIQS
jgi:hypothetical protein